ncbi:hypothetical protein HY768_10840 [candidate division TA06 bacterium]|uniref:Type II toxin-antitoxin system HicB family antitoxin n=1 Tax=candidate division TA06 bacterium TaxID=2250710 RepID=A0A933ICC6_UNCT6|nr:hypothetical protein [candidate division TA06 bacterium]
MQLLLNSAIYKKLSDGTWFAEIPSCKGVWVNQTDKRECEKELSEVLAEWRMLKQPVKTRRGALAA